ncbi:SGS domain-containing protein [Pyronema omphalodes]|nr:SGS domain-containing protein [Pyronema omphalodes]
MADPTTLAASAQKAFEASDYSQAIALYTQALNINPIAADWYLNRSVSHQRSGSYSSALEDAELAVYLFHQRGVRAKIGAAQLRRGIALQKLGKLGDADFCYKMAEKMVEGKDKTTVTGWKALLAQAMEKLEVDDPMREVMCEEIPTVVVPEATVQEKKDEVKDKGKQKEGQVAKKANPTPAPAPASAPAAATLPPPTGAIAPGGKVRHEWYQTNEDVVLTLYVKNVPKDRATIDIHETSLSITFPLAAGTDFGFDLDPFWAAVDVANSTYKILSTKVEVKLRKLETGRKWADLEGSHTAPAAAVSVAPKPAVELRPMYPSSSKTGSKDWDKVAADLTKKPNKKEGEEDDDGYDSDEADPVNGFFKKLYKDADEDTRRAMMKSFIESGGTALSTNWAEVGTKKVEVSPPQGMMAKSWNE